jgi:hypothetical protein
MMNITPGNLAISVDVQGSRQIAKAVFPLRYGRYSEIKTSAYEFVFNLNGEIKFIRGLGAGWPHPAEQLKRTDGNDWVYYSVGDDSSEKGLIAWMGEYYLPCLPYPSNAVWQIDYFANSSIMNALGAWSQLYADLFMAQKAGRLTAYADLVGRILASEPGTLHARALQLAQIGGERVTVLPPDTRHVDYEVVPLHIADGCLYHCDFCCVKSSKAFHRRPIQNLREQIKRLEAFYGPNLENYNALFLGNHDALAAGEAAIEAAASMAFEVFNWEGADRPHPRLYLFGSVASLLKAPNALFDTLERLPFFTCINIGFESVCDASLAAIGKPIRAADVRTAFQKMLDINRSYEQVEITGNFLMGHPLSSEHYLQVGALLAGAEPATPGKGAIYLSPLKDNPKKRELLPKFLDIKNQSCLPTFIYLIQRL